MQDFYYCRPDLLFIAFHLSIHPSIWKPNTCKHHWSMCKPNPNCGASFHATSRTDYISQVSKFIHSLQRHIFSCHYWACHAWPSLSALPYIWHTQRQLYPAVYLLCLCTFCEPTCNRKYTELSYCTSNTLITYQTWPHSPSSIMSPPTHLRFHYLSFIHIPP